MFLSNPFSLYIITDIYERFSQRSRFFIPPFIPPLLYVLLSSNWTVSVPATRPWHPGTYIPLPLPHPHTLSAMSSLPVIIFLSIIVLLSPPHTPPSLPPSLYIPPPLFSFFFSFYLYYYWPFNPPFNPSPSIVVSRTV